MLMCTAHTLLQLLPFALVGGDSHALLQGLSA